MVSCTTNWFNLIYSPVIITAIIIFISSVHGFKDYGNVVLSHIIFRHGDRSPLSIYPTDPYKDIEKYWPQGLRELSLIGKKQHHELGKYIRNRYKKFLPLKYHTNDTYVRSSDIERCLMSAQSNLLGFYPPSKNIKDPLFYQIVPIHTAPLVNDKLLFPYVNCQRYETDLSLLENSKTHRCIQKVTASVQEDVAKNAAIDKFDTDIYDTIHIQNLYNLSIPEWATKYYPQPLEALRLYDFLIKKAGTQELQRLTIGPVLKELVTNMINKSQDNLVPDRKLYIYSAHDTTISNLFMALDIHNGIIPPYASAVFVELRERIGKYYVMISYKNSSEHDPWVLKIPKCEILCPLNDFVELTTHLIPSDIASECKSNPEPGKLVHFQIPTNAVPKSWKKCFPGGKTGDGLYYETSYRYPEENNNVFSKDEL